MIKEVEQKDLTSFLLNETESPYRKYYGYYFNDNIIGYLSIDLIYDRIEIVNIFVKEAYRNRKFGSDMIKYLIELSRKNNIINITLEVRENNIYAIKLYEKYGFKAVAKRERYYGNINGILMELIL